MRLHLFERPVLDLGCGDGLVASMVLRRVEMGCDPSEAALREAVRLGLYQRLIPANLEDACLPEASVATILANSVLEHVRPLDRLLRCAVRVLKPGGSLLLTTPTEKFAEWLLLPLPSYAAWRNRRLGHVNLWPAEKWVDCLARFGLTAVSVRPYLRRSLVGVWDAFDLFEQVWVARRRLVGLIWRNLPLSFIRRLAVVASRLDLSAPFPGGGQLITARKEG